jgi:hypothetical protein
MIPPQKQKQYSTLEAHGEFRTVAERCARIAETATVW